MPNVTALPRTLENGRTLTQFTDTTSTSAVTYTYPTQQTGIQIENSGEKDITVTVGSYTNQLVKADTKWKATVSFTSFSILSVVNSQEFIATTFIEATYGTVKQVNGTIPDANGNVTIPIPQVDTSTLATKTEVQAVASGSPKGTYATLSDLQTAFPTGNANIYLVTADGKWYYWNGSAWTAGGVYQGVGIADGSVTGLKTDFLLINNLLNTATITTGQFLNGSNQLSTASYNVTDYIAIDQTKTYTVNYHRLTCFYDSNKAFISAYDTGLSSTLQEQNLVIPANSAYLRTNIIQSLYSSYYIFESSTKYKLNSNIITRVINPIDTTFIQKYNYLNGITLVNNYLLQNDGTTISNTSYTTTDFIPVKESSTYTAATHRRTVFYDVNKTVIGYLDSGVPTHAITDITTPAGTKYIKTTIPTTELTGWYLNAKSFSNLVISNEITIPNTAPSRFSTMVYCSIGDSITWQDGNTYAYNGQVARGYQTIVKEQLGFKSVINKGMSGWKLSDMYNEYSLHTTYYNDINLGDVITLFACTNDFQLNTPLGIETSFDTTTFCGVLNAFLRDITQANIGKPLLCMSTTQRRGFGVSGTYTTQQTNDIGLTLKDYIDKYVTITKNYGIPLLNLYECGGLNSYNIDTLTRDGLHPIDTGYVVIGYKIAGFIKNFA